MQYFQPKHSNYTYNERFDSGIFITSNGNIILSNYLYKKVLQVHAQDFIATNAYGFNITHDNHEISYTELSLIDNAISVCNLNDIILILLTNGKLVFIYQLHSREYIRMLNKTLMGIDIHYISIYWLENQFKILLYSNNVLYVINNSMLPYITFNIEKYEGVIGYFSGLNILLILYEDLKLECKPNEPLYLLKSDKTFVEVERFLNVNVELITQISIQKDCILILVKGKVKWYTFNPKPNKYIDELYKLNTIKQVDFLQNINLCLLDDGTLIFKLNKDSHILEKIYNIDKYLELDSEIVCLQFDGKVTMLDKFQNKKSEISNYYKKLNEFTMLNDGKLGRIQLELINRRYENSYTYKQTYYSLYLSTENTIETLEIISSKFVSLNKFLKVEEDVIKLNLLEYIPHSYI